jgi:hypothetical protein
MADPAAGGGTAAWTYASLTLLVPSWPGTKRGEWVVRFAGAEQFRTKDVLDAMDRLGALGWELVTLFPETGDRPAAFYFKKTREQPA